MKSYKIFAIIVTVNIWRLNSLEIKNGKRITARISIYYTRQVWTKAKVIRPLSEEIKLAGGTSILESTIKDIELFLCLVRQIFCISWIRGIGFNCFPVLILNRIYLNIVVLKIYLSLCYQVSNNRSMSKLGSQMNTATSFSIN